VRHNQPSAGIAILLEPAAQPSDAVPGADADCIRVEEELLAREQFGHEHAVVLEASNLLSKHLTCSVAESKLRSTRSPESLGGAKEERVYWQKPGCGRRSASDRSYATHVQVGITAAPALHTAHVHHDVFDYVVAEDGVYEHVASFRRSKTPG
jgi:hypothetical protein